jgi:hypothetical protein
MLTEQTETEQETEAGIEMTGTELEYDDPPPSYPGLQQSFHPVFQEPVYDFLTDTQPFVYQPTTTTNYSMPFQVFCL